MRAVYSVALLPLLALAAPASAQLLLPPLTVGVTGGTLGIGPEIAYRVIPAVSVRASATWLGFGVHGPVKGYEYDAHAHVANFGGSLDVHPFLNGFRLSAGARYTGSDRVRFHGMARSPQTYGGVTFTPEQAGELSGRIETRSVAPLVTAGYSHSFLGGLTVGVDGGVMFHGAPRVTHVSANGELGSNPLAQDELARQVQNLRDRVDNYKYYPVAQLSLGWRF